ncbi:MAG: hypothetical protein IJ390_01725 [Lachnospiraceae bacterium]|nr:hypothetical protein [Lachnospiraceae bacterium]
MNHYPKILPFYMTYPMPLFYEEEDTVMRDLEYLQEMYPKEARRYQQKVGRILDRFDYDGSVIYDEYPDRMTLYKMAQDMMAVITREEEQEKRPISKELLPHITELIQILLYNEIYKRRQAKGSGLRKF